MRSIAQAAPDSADVSVRIKFALGSREGVGGDTTLRACVVHHPGKEAVRVGDHDSLARESTEKWLQRRALGVESRVAGMRKKGILDTVAEVELHLAAEESKE